jgi:hypothetical protein
MTAPSASCCGRSGIHSRAGWHRLLRAAPKKEGAHGGTMGSPMPIVEAIVSVNA